MQASRMHACSANASASEMLCSSGHRLVTLEAAVCGNETRRSSRSHQLGLVGMLGGVSPATFSREKATMWLSSAVLIAYEKGDFSIPHKTQRWRVGPSKIMRRSGLYCSGKDFKVFILSVGCAMSSSLRRSKFAGYAAKESVPRW